MFEKVKNNVSDSQTKLLYNNLVTLMFISSFIFCLISEGSLERMPFAPRKLFNHQMEGDIREERTRRKASELNPPCRRLGYNHCTAQQ